MAKALILQADGRIAEHLSEVLAEEGITCTIGTSCKAGVRLLNDDRHIDCIIADMGLAMDGSFNLLTGMRGSPRLRNVPVLVTSTSPEHEAVLRAIEQGASDILLLPCANDQILAKVVNTISKGRPRVLVVDDDDMIRDLLCNLLEIERFSVTTAASAKDALTILEGESVRAVVTDMLMPEMSGMELLKEIKAVKPDLPVLIITGYAGHYNAADLKASGASGFLTKPFKNTELIRILKMAIRKAPSNTSSASETKVSG